MRDFLLENGEEILNTLGMGAAQKIAEKISYQSGQKRSRQIVYKVLKNDLPKTFKVSELTFELIAYAVKELIEEKQKTTQNVLREYGKAERQAA